MIKLNSQQRKAVEHEEGPCLVSSVPGSGKTAVLVERTARLIEKGIPAPSILCMTFTNKAAREMKERIQARIGGETLTAFVGTFHSFCVRLLRRWGDRIGFAKNFSIFDDSEQQALVKQLAKQSGYLKKDYDARRILRHLNVSRENLETREQLASRFDNEPVSWAIASDYLDAMKEQNCIDFSGLLYHAVELLKQEPKLLAALQKRFVYIQVDEMQDTNFIQFELVNLLAGKRCNVLIVGDVDQSVYRFRNARYQNIIDFTQQHPDYANIPLGKNYRSTPEIIATADKLICNNSSHITDVFETDNASGSPVYYQSFETPADEARWIARKINWYKDEMGYDGSEIAIFYRLNRLSMDLQPALREWGVNYLVIGGPNFFDRREIKDTIAMMKFLSNPKDATSFYRIIDLFSDIGDVTAHKLHGLAKENQSDLVTACKQIDTLTNRTPIRRAAKQIADVFDFDYTAKPMSDCFDHLMKKTKYIDRLQHKAADDKEFVERRDNIDTFLADAIESTSNKSDGIDQYLQSISLASSADEEADEDAVSLMTLHAAKGLEFDIVFMVGVEQKILPHYLAIQEESDYKGKKEAIEEERRICYVGITRAKQHLHLSSCRTRKIRKGKFIKYQETDASQFLQEAGLAKSSQWKTTKF